MLKQSFLPWRGHYLVSFPIFSFEELSPCISFLSLFLFDVAKIQLFSHTTKLQHFFFDLFYSFDINQAGRNSSNASPDIEAPGFCYLRNSCYRVYINYRWVLFIPTVLFYIGGWLTFCEALLGKTTWVTKVWSAGDQGLVGGWPKAGHLLTKGWSSAKKMSIPKNLAPYRIL